MCVLPTPGEQDDVLGAVEEAELVQALDLLALDARLEGEVELGQRLDGRQARAVELTPRVWRTLFADDPLRSDLDRARDPPTG